MLWFMARQRIRIITVDYKVSGKKRKKKDKLKGNQAAVGQY